MEHLSEKIIEIVGKPILINPLPPTPGSPEEDAQVFLNSKEISVTKKVLIGQGTWKTFQWYNKFVFSGSEKYAI